MSSQLKAIQKVLNQKADKKNKEFFSGMVLGKQKIYGVKTPELNLLASQYKSGSFELAVELWESGALEERVIAIKIMEKMGKNDPEKLLRLFRKFSSRDRQLGRMRRTGYAIPAWYREDACRRYFFNSNQIQPILQFLAAAIIIGHGRMVHTRWIISERNHAVGEESGR